MEVRLARAWFAVQAVAGAVWWVAVFASDDVRRLTLGGWPPGLLVGPDLALFVGAAALAAAMRSRVAAVVSAAWTAAVTVALTGYGLVTREAGWGVVAMALATVGGVAAAGALATGSLPTAFFFRGPFAFRVAAERAPGAHVRRSLVQLVVFWSTFFLVVPLVVAAAEHRLGIDAPALDQPALRAAAVATFLAASAIGLWSCLTMARVGAGTPLPSETARHLVATGPYRWVRNPMAVAGAVQTASVGLVTGSWVVVVLAIAGAVAWHVAIRPAEEADLAARLGAPYEAYRAAVRCWVPRRRATITR